MLTESLLDLQVGARARARIPLAAILACETIRDSRAEWCKRRGVHLRDTVVVSPIDRPNGVLRLAPGARVPMSHYQCERMAPPYIFLYLDRPELLASSLAAAREEALAHARVLPAGA